MNPKVLSQIEDLILKCVSAKEQSIPMLIQAQIQDRDKEGNRVTLQIYLVSNDTPEQMNALLGYEKEGAIVEEEQT